MHKAFISTPGEEKHPSGSDPQKFCVLRAPRQVWGFTLIELLIVIAVIAILSVVVILAVNPAELLKQARDSNRLSDMDTINRAVALYQSDLPSGSLGSSTVVYLSLVDNSATSSAGTNCQGVAMNASSLPSGWTWHCSASSTLRNLDGTGWMPINLSSISSGAPLSKWATDPINASSSLLYYSYVPGSSQWEVASAMESSKYKLGGGNDSVSTDGGGDPQMFEKGTNLSLMPIGYGDSSLIDWLKFDEGSGTAAADSSGMNYPAALNAFATWPAGKVGSYALGVVNGSSFASLTTTLPSSTFSLAFWENASSFNAGVSGNWNLIMGGEVYTASGFRSGFSGSGCYQFWTTQSGGTLNFTGSPCISTGQWNFWTVTFQNSSASMYLNGSLIASSTGTYVKSANLPGISDGIGGVQFFTGSVDDVRIYNRALTTAEISAIYNATK